MRSVSLLAAITVLLWSPGAFAECRQNATPEQIETVKVKTLANPNVRNSVMEADYLKVTIEKPDGSLILSYFTLPSHPAHPSNLLSAIFEYKGRVWLSTKGFTAGDCQLFEQWMSSFKQQHERVRQAFMQNRP